MKQMNVSRRNSMKTIIVAGGACLALSQVTIFKQPKKVLASTSTNKDHAKSIAASEELALTAPEQEIFIVIKQNLIHSKTVKDEQIAKFSKIMVDMSPASTDFKTELTNFQQEFHLMNYFIKYIHA